MVLNSKKTCDLKYTYRTIDIQAALHVQSNTSLLYMFLVYYCNIYVKEIFLLTKSICEKIFLSYLLMCDILIFFSIESNS